MLAAVLAAGCGSASSGGAAKSPAPVPTTPAPASAQIVARPLAPYGTVLTNADGFALYVFAPDGQHHVTCVGACAQAWPPVRPAGRLPTMAGAGVKRSLLGADADPDGGSIVTYNGWPLYTYVGDHAPGYPSGEALNIDGGEWYLISADGQVVKSGA